MEVRESLKGDQGSAPPKASRLWQQSTRKYVDPKAVKGQNVLDAAANRSAQLHEIANASH
jgi:hypothetical protein